MMRKLINKLNIADYFLIIFFVIALFASYLMFFRKSTYIEIVMKVTNRNVLYSDNTPPAWYADKFQKGMTERDSFGRLTAEIIDVFTYDSSSENKAVYLTVKMRAVYNKNTKGYKYNGIDLVTGEGLRVRFNSIMVEGLITNILTTSSVQESKKVLVKTKLNYKNNTYPDVEGVEPFLADTIKIGDKIYDSKNNILAEVVGKRVVPAKRYTYDFQGNVYQKPDPRLLEVQLDIEVAAEERNNKLYFLSDIPLMVPLELPLHFSKYDIYPTIISFEVK